MDTIEEAYTPGPTEMRFTCEYRTDSGSGYDYKGLRYKSKPSGWYIENKHYVSLTNYEIKTISEWCKNSLEDYWKIEWDHIYISLESDFTLFKLTLMVNFNAHQ